MTRNFPHTAMGSDRGRTLDRLSPPSFVMENKCLAYISDHSPLVIRNVTRKFIICLILTINSAQAARPRCGSATGKSSAKTQVSSVKKSPIVQSSMQSKFPNQPIVNPLRSGGSPRRSCDAGMRPARPEGNAKKNRDEPADAWMAKAITNYN